jgi:pyridoxal 5'-phosphate synthase pdxS subunit
VLFRSHFVEAQILEALQIDYIDESEVLTPADEECHIDKSKFSIPFVCGARNLGEALRRIAEGAAMIRTKGEAGTGNVVEAVRHMRAINREIRVLTGLPVEEVTGFAKTNGIPYELALQVKNMGRLPVVNFAAGGIATPADAALMMQLGCDGIFVGSGIFKSANPDARARAIVKATAYFNDPEKILEASTSIGDAMPGLEISEIPKVQLLAGRGWQRDNATVTPGCSQVTFRDLLFALEGGNDCGKNQSVVKSGREETGFQGHCKCLTGRFDSSTGRQFI